jgi:hypothetical protein
LKLTGIIELSKGIPLKANCLNKSFYIKINGISAELITSSLPKNFKDKRDDYRNNLIQPDKGIMFNKSFDWGQPFSWPSGESSVARFKIILELPEEHRLEDVKNELINETENWIDRFEDNLYIIGYNIHISNVETEDQNLFRIDYYYNSQEDEKIEMLQSDKIESLTIKIGNSIDLKDLIYVLDITSEGKDLCLEYVLLQDSQIALDQSEYRKSVLDCATAFEIGLTKYLKSNLSISNVDLLNKILKMNNSIFKKRELLKFTSLTLPNYDYQKNLEELRNRAIHDGKDITKDEAELAYKMVTQALKLLVSEKIV